MDGLLDQTVAELGTAVAELRQIAHGLRPSSLDDGLGAALRRLRPTVPIPVELDVEPEPLPDDVATTVYYVASEAIANAVKHADATRIERAGRARRRAARRSRCSDDGRGGATARPARGWPGSATGSPRSAARCSVRSAPGRGTIVEAVLPCAS